MSKTALSLLNTVEQNWLVERIKSAEQFTTGEIRVHLEDYTLSTSLERASEVFAELKMHETRFRNGVLIYVAVRQNNFCIIGDMGINHVVNEGFWQKQVELLRTEFKKENYYEGLVKVVKQIGQILRKEFPVGGDLNPNELPDDISFA